jgi:hypothetical protein
MSNYRKTMASALQEMYPLDESVIDKVKEIDSKKSAAKIDGVMVDSFTASAISQIYDKVNDANKKKMEKLPIIKLANLAMKMMQKNDYVPEEVDLDEAQDGGDFKPHMMYDPKTGKGYKADTMDDHLKMKKMGYTHDAPKTEEVDLDEGGMKDLLIRAQELMGPSKNRKEGIQMVAKGLKVSEKEATKLVDAVIKMNEEVDLEEGKMSQLHQYIKDKKSAEEIAKLMKVDVATIKKLMSSHHPEDVEEGAAADARRAMSKDKDLRRGKDSADDDDNASDDDVKAASKNIMMQMRKAISLRGRFDVEFADGKKVKIPAKMAQLATKKYSAKKPADKEKFQAKIGKSYKDMLSALKEELQPQKESILERMNRKLKENKDG